MQQVVVAISGASGSVYGVRLLQRLREFNEVQVHLVVSQAGWLNLQHELGLDRQALQSMVHTVHEAQDIGAPIASGSFQFHSMVIAPCSMRTLAAVAHALSDNLITRAADVMLKERRRLVLMARETPLNLAHLRNMVSVTEMGGIIYPPVPAFYHQPRSVSELVDHSVDRVLDLLGWPSTQAARWAGPVEAAAAATGHKG